MSIETEPLAARFRPPYKLVVETFPGKSAYETGGNWFFSKILKRLERATCIQGTGGWRGEVVTGSVRSGMHSGGNAFRLKVWTAGATTQCQEPAADSDLSDQFFTLLLEGL